MSEEYRDGVLLAAPLWRVLPGAGTDGHALIETTSVAIWRDQKRWVNVPIGFVCDGASVPNALFPLLDATAFDLLIPGLFHDKLYRSGAEMFIESRLGYRPFDRHDADKVLSKICGNMGISWLDRQKIFYAVRVGGSGSWQQKSESWRPG